MAVVFEGNTAPAPCPTIASDRGCSLLGLLCFLPAGRLSYCLEPCKRPLPVRSPNATHLHNAQVTQRPMWSRSSKPTNWVAFVEGIWPRRRAHKRVHRLRRLRSTTLTPSDGLAASPHFPMRLAAPCRQFEPLRPSQAASSSRRRQQSPVPLS
jgi:hypothetical protein